jgi:predicted regulator of Ras-like GTPase activity (Roadblock/LC7/MglB family)
MPTPQLVLYEQELTQLAAVCASLQASTDAQAVILVDKNGQFIASHGDVSGFDTTSLASLTAGNMASTQGLANLIGEAEFPSVYHEGKNESLLLSVVASQAILVVMFDQRTTLGLVRLRVKKPRKRWAAFLRPSSKRLPCAKPRPLLPKSPTPISTTSLAARVLPRECDHVFHQLLVAGN